MPHLESLCDPQSGNVYISVPAYKNLSSQLFLFSIVFIVVSSITKQICSFTRVLFVTLFAGLKIDKTLIVTVQTMVNLKSVSIHCAIKYRSVSYIIASFKSSFTSFCGTYFSLQCI